MSEHIDHSISISATETTRTLRIEPPLGEAALKSLECFAIFGPGFGLKPMYIQSGPDQEEHVFDTSSSHDPDADIWDMANRIVSALRAQGFTIDFESQYYEAD